MLPLCKHQTVLVRKMEINLCNAGAPKQLSLLQKCNMYKYLYKLNICVCIHIHAHIYLCSRFQFLYIPPLNKVRDPHAVKNPPITLQSVPHFHGLASMDSTKHRLYSAGLCIYVLEKKNLCINGPMQFRPCCSGVNCSLKISFLFFPTFTMPRQCYMANRCLKIS